MALPSVDNKDKSAPKKEYFERVLRWIPSNFNPDIVWIISFLGIIIDLTIIIKILMKMEGIGENISVSILIEFAKDNFIEVGYIALLSILLFILSTFVYFATQRILEENSLLKVPLEEFFNFINEPRVARFYMQLFLMVTGLIMLRELTDRKFPVLDTIEFMMIWFVLLLLLPIPEGAKTDIDPFNE